MFSEVTIPRKNRRISFYRLDKEFHEKGIPTDKPDFYDYPNFIKEEQ